MLPVEGQSLTLRMTSRTEVNDWKLYNLLMNIR